MGSKIMPKCVFGLRRRGRIACTPFPKRDPKSPQGPKSKISILDVSKQKQQDTQKIETTPITSTVKNTYPPGYILETNTFFHFEDYPEILECANQIKNVYYH